MTTEKKPSCCLWGNLLCLYRVLIGFLGRIEHANSFTVSIFAVLTVCDLGELAISWQRQKFGKAVFKD